LTHPANHSFVPAMLDPELIPLLRCPTTKQPLRHATEEEKRERGIPADEPVLITSDGFHLYRAECGMPILLPAQGMTNDQSSTTNECSNDQ
jgi:uncharacterized protein YbaR (Trm112 family)